MNYDYYKISEEELGKGAKIPIIKTKNSNDAFYALAKEMFDTIQDHNAKGEKTVFICPVGPVGHYPIFVDMVNEHKLSLKNVWFFNMDEYLDDSGHWIADSHALSFRGFMERNVYSKILEELVMPPEQRIFPDPSDCTRMDMLLDELGGADICFGGIGINGHVAFNEPNPSLSPEEFANLGTRILQVSPETLVTNAIGELGGAIEAMPKTCITIGMKQILGAKKVRLAVFRDWHRAVCRRAVYGEISSDFPVTLLQKHKDACIIVNDVAAQAAIQM